MKVVVQNLDWSIASFTKTTWLRLKHAFHDAYFYAVYIGFIPPVGRCYTALNDRRYQVVYRHQSLYLVLRELETPYSFLLVYNSLFKRSHLVLFWEFDAEVKMYDLFNAPRSCFLPADQEYIQDWQGIIANLLDLQGALKNKYMDSIAREIAYADVCSFLFVNYTMPAIKIQRAWRRCVSNPAYAVCCTRLERECIELMYLAK